MTTAQRLVQATDLPIATLLPPEAARLLQRAAKTPIARADPLARVKAIERACERVKRRNPELFR